MQSVAVGTCGLACPVGMGLMMWIMMRGQGASNNVDRPRDKATVDELRAEIERLKAERAAELPADGP